LKRLIVHAGANGAGKSSLRAGGADPVDVEIDPDRIARQVNPADPRGSGLTMNMQTENTNLASGGEQDALIEIGFADLPIQLRNLSNAGLWRPPTWNEIFAAVHSVVDEVSPGGLFMSGNVALPIPERHSGGRCFLYAGTTWALISMLLEKVPTGVVVGGVSIQSTQGADCRIILPKDPRQPQPFSGGYHAWTIFEHDGEDYGVDMAYFWFKQHSSVIGPSRFFVARRTTLEELGINYYPSATLTHSFGLGEDLKRYASLLGPVCANLRQFIGKAPLGRRIRDQLSSAGTWFRRRHE